MVKADNGERLQKAYDRLLFLLFGDISKEQIKEKMQEGVTEEQYIKALEQTEKEFGLELGDPDFIEWTLVLIGRSPRIKNYGYSE